MSLSSKKAQILIPYGEGLNCERETAKAFEETGVRAKLIHLSELKASHFQSSQGLCLPGGFSFGDELSSGQVLAQRLRSLFQEELSQLSQRDQMVLGICNGFQGLVKLGVFCEEKVQGKNTNFALAPNKSGQFICRWIKVRAEHSSSCLWTGELHKQKIESFWLPIRHGEGRLISKSESFQEKIALFYHEDVNGSHHLTAGLSAQEGRVLGLMPHPEASFFPFQVPKSLKKNQRKDWLPWGRLIIESFSKHYQ